METYYRFCIKDHSIMVPGGEQMVKLEKGKEYLTSESNELGNVIVFSQYWFDAPVSLFAGKVRFT